MAKLKRKAPKKTKTENGEEKKKKKAVEDPLAEALDEVNAVFADDGVEAVGLVSRQVMQPLSTGILALDRCLGGGVARGHIIEFHGPEGEGKTTIALKFIGKQIKDGFTGLWIDAEKKLDVFWAAKFGIKTLKMKRAAQKKLSGADLARYARRGYMLLLRPTLGEDAFDAMRKFAGLIDIIVVDSINQLTPKEITEKSMHDKHRGVKPRMISDGLDRTLSANSGSKPTTFVFVNQVTIDMNKKYGNPETTPGGRKLKHLAMQRVRVGRTQSDLDETTDPKGHRVLVKTVKNQYYPPRRVAEFNLMYDGRFDDKDQILCMLQEFESLGPLEIRERKKKKDGEKKMCFAIGEDEYGTQSGFLKAITPEQLAQAWEAAEEIIAGEVEKTRLIVDDDEATATPDEEEETNGELTTEI